MSVRVIRYSMSFIECPLHYRPAPFGSYALAQDKEHTLHIVLCETVK